MFRKMNKNRNSRFYKNKTGNKRNVQGIDSAEWQDYRILNKAQQNNLPYFVDKE